MTGASRGIGLAVARELAAAGANLWLVARDREALAVESDSLAAAYGVSVRWLSVDLTEENAPQRIATAVSTPHIGAGVDILIHNAGGSQPATLDSLVEAARAPSGYWLNCLVHVELTRALLPHMRERRWGRVINIAGIAARQPAEINVTSMAKASLYTFSKVLSREVAAEGVTVNFVSVGKIDTPQIRRRYATPGEWAAVARSIPMGRLGDPADVAAAVAFLASVRAGYITGSVLTVDGGLNRSVY